MQTVNGLLDTDDMHRAADYSSAMRDLRRSARDPMFSLATFRFRHLFLFQVRTIMLMQTSHRSGGAEVAHSCRAGAKPGQQARVLLH